MDIYSNVDKLGYNHKHSFKDIKSKLGCEVLYIRKYMWTQTLVLLKCYNSNIKSTKLKKWK